MQAIGYRNMVEYIKNSCPWDEAVRIMKRDTRRYAKRQLTWFKADPEITWMEPDRLNDMKVLIRDFLSCEKI